MRDRDEHGVGVRRSQDPLDVERPAADGHAEQPAAEQARVVVDEADDALARGLAQLAEQAAARAAGADDQRAAAVALRQRRAARNSARSPKREAPITTMQSSASRTKTLAGKLAERSR